jgi:hypothetical protein
MQCTTQSAEAHTPKLSAEKVEARNETLIFKTLSKRNKTNFINTNLLLIFYYQLPSCAPSRRPKLLSFWRREEPGVSLADASPLKNGNADHHKHQSEENA